MLASIVIRTLNEAQHLDDLMVMIGAQQTNGLDVEVVLIDSGSTDGTVEIAERGQGGLFAAFGHSHYGLMMAPKTGEVLADIISGCPANAPLDALKMDRFL